MIAHRYSLPSAVGCSVMSVSHFTFGASAVKSLRTKSSCTGGPALRLRPFFLACRHGRRDVQDFRVLGRELQGEQAPVNCTPRRQPYTVTPRSVETQYESIPDRTSCLSGS